MLLPFSCLIFLLSWWHKSECVANGWEIVKNISPFILVLYNIIWIYASWCLCFMWFGKFNFNFIIFTIMCNDKSLNMKSRFSMGGIIGVTSNFLMVWSKFPCLLGVEIFLFLSSFILHIWHNFLYFLISRKSFYDTQDHTRSKSSAISILEVITIFAFSFA